MKTESKRGAFSLGLALVVLAFSALASVAVRPSAPKPGISDLEQTLLGFTLPCLVAGGVFALVALGAALKAQHRYVGLFGVLSILFVNGAGLLAGQFGVDGVGLTGTLLPTLPVALVLAQRETVLRREEKQSSAEQGSRSS
jgi:hypothetical protein